VRSIAVLSLWSFDLYPLYPEAEATDFSGIAPWNLHNVVACRNLWQGYETAFFSYLAHCTDLSASNSHYTSLPHKSLGYSYPLGDSLLAVVVVCAFRPQILLMVTAVDETSNFRLLPA
jgi:hypothetical protein